VGHLPESRLRHLVQHSLHHWHDPAAVPHCFSDLSNKSTPPSCEPFRGFKASWVWSSDLKTINITMSAPTTGWIGFGISATGSPDPHENGDMWVGWVSQNNLTLLDTYAPSSARPTYDTLQNLTPLTFAVSGGATSISFSRLANTGDTAQDVVISPTEPLYVLWSYCEQTGTSPTKYPIHTSQGTDMVTFSATPTLSAPPSVSTPPDSPPPTGTVQATQFTSPAGDFTLKWNVSSDRSNITFTMSAVTTGWLSFGLSTTGQPSPHENAEMYVAWVSEGGTTLLDTTGTSASQPAYNARQNCDLISGEQVSGVTTVIFSRPVTVSDPAAVSLTNASLYVLWAYAPTPGTGAGPTATYQEHTQAGTTTLNFLTVTASPSSNPSPTSPLDAAEILLICVLGLFFLMVVARFTHRCLKYQKVRQVLKSGEFELSATAAVLDDDVKVEVVQPRAVRSSTVRPMSQYYGGRSAAIRQSRIPMTARGGADPERQNTEDFFATISTGGLPKQWGDGTSPWAQSSKSESALEMPAKAIGAKSSGNRAGNALRGALLYRIPGTQKSFGSIVLALFYIGLNLLALMLGRGNDYASKLGALSSANSLLVVIAATRNSVLVFLLGIPFDRVIMYHRWLGYFTLLVNCLHFILEMVYWAIGNLNLAQQLFFDLRNLYGFVGWFLCVFIFVTSVSWIRRNHFEWFFYLHFLFAPYFAFGALHNKQFLPYMIAAMSVYGLDRLIRLLWGLWPAKAFLRIKGKRPAGGDREHTIIQVSFPKNSLAELTGAYKVGQYVFVNFPQLSLLEWHPFSISSGPDESTLEIHIRSLGDHTAQVLARAEKSPFLWIRVDGPYGNLGLKLRRFPNIVLAAGGIGISPVIGMVKDLYRCGNLDFCGVKSPSHVVEDIRILWVARSPAQYTWFEEEVAMFIKAAQSPALPRFHADIYLTGVKENDSGYQALLPVSVGRASLAFHVGRPDLTQFCSDSISVDKANLIFVCGPSQMVSSLWDASVVSSTKGSSVRFHHEIFEF